MHTNEGLQSQTWRQLGRGSAGKKRLRLAATHSPMGLPPFCLNAHCPCNSLLQCFFAIPIFWPPPLFFGGQTRSETLEWHGCHLQQRPKPKGKKMPRQQQPATANGAYCLGIGTHDTAGQLLLGERTRRGIRCRRPTSAASRRWHFWLAS